MREAKTIYDLKELFRDFDVKVELIDTRIELTFPDREDDIPTSRTPELPMTGTPSIDFSRHTRNTIRSLCETPRFWRLTTVADQIHRFHLSGEKVGIIKAMKRGGKPLTILFESSHKALEFYNAILR